jgi:preprotein translocase subunit SecG
MQVLNIFHVLIAIGLVAFVLVQRGQGATAGAAFGSGASGTVFGSRGAGTFLTRATWVLSALFCAISLTMAVVVSRTVNTTDTDLGVIGSTPQTQTVVDEVEPQTITLEPSLTADEAADTDLPALDTSAQPVINEGADSQALDDVPALDGSATGSEEETREEGGTAAGSDS